jgi:hypothetical protein
MMRFLVLTTFLVGCTINTQTGTESVTENPAATPENKTPTQSAPPQVIYPTIGALHEKALARTCALNNGVCHNSKEYPDLRAPSGLVAAVNKPCNVNADLHDQIQDVCEPEGDRLVLTDGSAKLLDAEIARVEVKEVDMKIESVVVSVASDVASGLKTSDTMKLEVHRGATVFTLKNASISAVSGRSLTLGVRYADPAVRTFLDDRKYPWHEGIVRVADPNGNGVLGHSDPKSAGHASIVPGDPMKSFLILRLIDETKGGLMPLQCREWDDTATRALGCWIKGLKLDAAGNVTNADAPIDYAACDFDPGGKGRCKTIEASGGRVAVEGIAARSCGGSGCHVDEKVPAAGLDLSAGKLRDSLINIASTQVTGAMRVVPGNADDSYFLCKMDPTCTKRRGALMPAGAQGLPPSELAIIRQWIADGAL